MTTPSPLNREGLESRIKCERPSSWVRKTALSLVTEVLGGDGNLVQNRSPVFAFAGGVGVPVEAIAGDEGEGHGGFGIDHLLIGEVDLAPAAGFLEGRAGESAVAGVGYGDLDGVLVHGSVDAEDLRGDDNVLGEVLGSAAAEHEEASGRIGDLELRELVEVLGGVDGDHRLA